MIHTDAAIPPSGSAWTVVLTPRLLPGMGPLDASALRKSADIVRQRMAALHVSGTVGAGRSTITLHLASKSKPPQALWSRGDLTFRQVYGITSGTNVAAASPSTDPALPTLPTRCDSLPRLAENLNSPSGWSTCTYQTVKCPTYTPGPGDDTLNTFTVACERSTDLKYLLYPVAVTGTGVSGATAVVPQTVTGSGEWVVDVSFNASGQKEFTQLTKDTLGAAAPANQVAIVVDDVVQSAPVTQEVIPGDASISGDFNEEQATNLAAEIRFGALPVAFDASETSH